MKDILERIKEWQKQQGVVGAMPIHLLLNDCYLEIKKLREETNSIDNERKYNVN